MSVERQYHPAANTFPLMGEARYQELRDDLKKHGQREAITLCDEMVLDGRNRYRACLELGLEPVTRTFNGDPWSYAWSLNGQRRDLLNEQRYLIWKHCNEHSEAWQVEKDRIAEEANRKRSEAAKEQERVATDTGKTVFSEKSQVRGHSVPAPEQPRPGKSAKAAASKTNAGAVARGDKLAKERPDLAEAVRMGTMKPALAHRQMKKEEKGRALTEAQASIIAEKSVRLESVCDLRTCACLDLFKSGIKPDVVITDPPYPAEFLPVFSELAEGCELAGVPVVAVMSGQSYLPEVLRRLCERLKYRWTLAYMMPGGQAVQQWPAKVNTFWKPVLLFGESLEWFGDVAASKTNDNDKRFHDWGQSESGMADLIERLTQPGQLICDPFLGGGTTAVVALQLGRRFVGCDIDPDCVEQTKKRIR